MGVCLVGLNFSILKRRHGFESHSVQFFKEVCSTVEKSLKTKPRVDSSLVKSGSQNSLKTVDGYSSTKSKVMMTWGSNALVLFEY